MSHEIPFGRPMIGDAERAAVADVLAGPVLTHGPRVKEFEAAFAEFTGAPYAIATATCMAALHLSYLAHGLGAGDEVIVPAQTHVATAHAVELCGATPVFCDAEPRTGNIDSDALEALVTERTRAISLVHYLGRPVDMRPLMEVAEKHGLFVVEDAAVALGARIDGTHAGLIGATGCFSFYPVKHITTGEGGMLVTTDEEIAEKVARQRAFGIDKSFVSERRHSGAYDVVDAGLNYRLGEVGAAMGIEQLKRLPDFLEARARNWRALAEGLRGVEGLRVLESDSEGGLEASHYCLVAVLDEPLEGRREELIERLKAGGIGTSVYYPKALPDLAYYREKYGHAEGSCPVASRISNHSLAFPVAPHLKDGDVDRIVESTREAVAEVRDARVA